jgi:hypothetical protein
MGFRTLQGTEYTESDFVFSVAKYPEPQILPAATSLRGEKKMFLLDFDMSAFDLLGVTIADVG